MASKRRKVDGGEVGIPEVREMALEELVGWEGNPREIGEEELAGLGRSLREFGLVEDPVWNRRTGRLVGGHQRVRILREAGARVVPVKVVDLDEAREAALCVALNSRELQGRFTGGLGEVLRLVEEGAPDLMEGLRFEELAESEGASLEGGVGESGAVGGGDANDGEAIPEPPVEPETRDGDVWVLGDHRLICGDAFSAEARWNLLEGVVADCVVTDPPYAIYGSSSGVSSDVADDKMVRPFFESLGRALATSLGEFGHAYVFCDWRSWASLWVGLRTGGGLTPRNMIVWDKGGFGLGSNYANNHELVAFFARLPPERTMKSGRATGQREVHRPNVIRADRTRGEDRLHNAAKPVGVLEELIRNSTDAGQRVLDLFGGSGSTLVACERQGRRALVSEIEPKWCDVIAQRWARLTGREPRRV